jgi:hypothetical protein
LLNLPTCRNTFDEFFSFKAGKAEANEPFAIDFFGQLFQQSDAAPVVFN